MASFPNSVRTFTTKNDGAGNTIFAVHINDLQAEVTALEDGLLNATAPLTLSTVTLTHLIVSGGLSVAVGSTLATLNVTSGSTFTTINASGISTLSELFVIVPPPSVRVSRSAVTAVPSTVATGVSFDVQTSCYPASMHSTTTNSSRLVAPSSGVYLVTANVAWANFSTAGIRLLELWRNDTGLIGASRERTDPSATATRTEQTVSAIYALAANDYVTLVVQHDAPSTGSLLAAVSSVCQDFTLTKIR